MSNASDAQPSDARDSVVEPVKGLPSVDKTISSTQQESKIKVYKMPKGSEQSEVIGRVNEYMATLKERASNDLISKGSDAQPEPFELRLSDKRMTLFVPSNINDVDCLLFRQMIDMATDLSAAIVATDKESLISPENPTEKEFFYAFFRVILRKPAENESFTFNFDTPQQRGAAQAKLIILQRALGSQYNNIKDFLPKNLFGDKGTSKLDLEINAKAKSKESHINVVKETLRKLIAQYLKFHQSAEWFNLALGYRIPVALALEGLHKSKTVKVKNRVETQIKKPKKPSKRIEVYLESERIVLSKLEEGFAKYSEYVKSLPKEGISASEIVNVRTTVRTMIASCWSIVERTSAIITKRRAPLLAEGSEKRNDKDLTKAKVDKALEMLRQKPLHESWETLATINPKKLLIKICPEDALYLSKMELNHTGYVLPDIDKLSDNSRAVMEEFIKTFGLSPGRTLAKAPKVSKRAQQRARYDIEDDDDMEITTEGHVDPDKH